ncbi:MAG: alpha/beta hydrolase [Anaerolineales bacterium]
MPELPDLAFLHANGYPPECYVPLIERLVAGYRIHAMPMRPLHPDANPRDLHNWRPLADDLLNFLDARSLERPFVVGHSFGAVTSLRVAIREPGRIRALVLLDPVLFEPHIILLWKLIRALGLAYKLHPLVPGALKRRRKFDDLEGTFKRFRRYSVFRYFSDEALWAYLRGITRPAAGGGYELRYSPEWEARIYVTSASADLELWRGLKTLPVPTLILRGAETDTFSASAGRRVERVNPAIRVETIPQSTHLLALERPIEIASKIEAFFGKLQSNANAAD